MAVVVTNAGRAWFAKKAAGTETGTPSFVAWGTGAGTAGVTDTTLFTEASEARVSGTLSTVTTTVTDDTLQLTGTMTVAGAGKTITNVGQFDASTSGDMLMKADFTGLALDVGDSIAFTLKIKQA